MSSVVSNFEAKTFTVSMKPDKEVTEEVVKKALKDAGFEFTSFKKAEVKKDEPTEKKDSDSSKEK